MPDLHDFRSFAPRAVASLFVALLLGVAPRPSGAAAPVPTAVPVPKAVADAVAAPDRSDADRALDGGRHPAETLAFFAIAPGEKVADLGAGGGYTSELLARVVGQTGVVYGQNPRLVLERFAEKPWSERLKKPINAKIVRVDREFDDPLPPDAHDLDAVVIVLFYHDTVWQGVDRSKMNAAIFRALRPGGVYGIVDHSARTGSGTQDVKTLHRIEETVVKQEVEAAGFKLAGEAEFLRNPSDKRDWNDSPVAAGEKRGESDRFC